MDPVSKMPSPPLSSPPPDNSTAPKPPEVIEPPVPKRKKPLAEDASHEPAPRTRMPVTDAAPPPVKLPGKPLELVEKLVGHFEHVVDTEPKNVRARNTLYHLREVLPHVRELAGS